MHGTEEHSRKIGKWWRSESKTTYLQPGRKAPKEGNQTSGKKAKNCKNYVTYFPYTLGVVHSEIIDQIVFNLVAATKKI